MITGKSIVLKEFLLYCTSSLLYSAPTQCNDYTRMVITFEYFDKFFIGVAIVITVIAILINFCVA